MTQISRRPVTPRRSMRRRSSAQKVTRFFGGLALLTLTAASVYGGYLYRTTSTFQKYLPPLFQHQSVSEVFPGQPALNLMIIGRDRDYDDRTDQILKSRARSDMLMVAHVDFVKNTVSLLSIPRDTLAHIPGHGTTKINAAHEFGGPALSEQVVQNTFGINSDKYIALDFEGFEQAIDILGGVDLNVDKKMDYDDNWGHLHIHLKPGMQHLDGKQAMGFVRFRHSDSDLVRTRRQQTLLAALKDKLRSPAALAEIGSMLDTIDKHIDSDLTAPQEVALARFVHDTPHQQVSMETLPSLPVGNNVATNWPEARPMIQSIFGAAPPEVAMAADDTEGHHRRRRHHHPVRVASLP
ncbi:MAG: LCP family protein [Janthinobacterium lividum]